MSAFKDRLVAVLEDIRDELRDAKESRKRLEAAVSELSKDVSCLRDSLDDQSARLAKRVTAHDVRLRHLEEARNGAE